MAKICSEMDANFLKLMLIFLCDLIGESGVCNMCNGGVNFVLDNDPVGYLLLLPLALLHLRSYGSIADLFSLESLSGSKKGVYSILFGMFFNCALFWNLATTWFDDNYQ